MITCGWPICNLTLLLSANSEMKVPDQNHEFISRISYPFFMAKFSLIPLLISWIWRYISKEESLIVNNIIVGSIAIEAKPSGFHDQR
jgi:hypothetical protein